MAARLINQVQSKNRARPMAAWIKKKKPGVEQEPRSAHGRAVKKINKLGAEQETRSAHGRAVKKNDKPGAEQEPRSAG